MLSAEVDRLIIQMNGDGAKKDVGQKSFLVLL